MPDCTKPTRLLVHLIASIPLIASSACIELRNDAWFPGVVADGFISVSEHGFGAADNQRDINDYPWAMAYFKPDDAETGYVYTGTGNNIINTINAQILAQFGDRPDRRPPEIRRYRPDLGIKHWVPVLDYRHVEDGPDWQTSGFRSMAVYRAPTDNKTYLYAGTVGETPTLWRSDTGDHGSWEPVWINPIEGSIRSLAVHNDILYIAVTHEVGLDNPPGELYATDGDTVWLINDDGFSNPNNTGLSSLASFNGYLYVGTWNLNQGYEVWKTEGPDGSAQPVRIVANGGTGPANQIVSQMCVFQNHLYVPALIFSGLNRSGDEDVVRGADMIRIDTNDNVQTVVGPDSVGGVGSGFDKFTNGYLWCLTEHQGKLYCGTWDTINLLYITKANEDWLNAAFIKVITQTLFGSLLDPFSATAKSGPNTLDFFMDNGAGLYVSPDGVQWSTVFANGLGNPDNSGVRNLVSTDQGLYLGMTNVFEGLEIWLYDPN